MAATEITINTYFDRETPDGSQCKKCKSECWHVMWQLFAGYDGAGRGKVAVEGVVLCDQCHRWYMEQGDEA